MSDRLIAPIPGLDQALLTLVLDEHRRNTLPRLERLWDYFRNDSETVGMAPWAAKRTRLAQEAGLPHRFHPSGRDPRLDDRWNAAPEVVIENDIAWRLHTMVDFMVGRPPRLLSNHPDPARAADIQLALDAVWEASGGITLLQDTALLGHVYGHVDLLVRADPPGAPDSAEHPVRIELIEPTRGVPIQSPGDYRSLDAYAVVTRQHLNALDPDASRPTRLVSTRVEVLTHSLRQVYQDDTLVEEAPEPAFEGRIPVVHIQNLAQPFHYAGLSEVEPLIPLQDELNTRLSDRAFRVTLQSFRMYLTKGFDAFDGTQIGPGRVFSTDNPDASIQSFGGDADSPSESRHIDEIREAMDKASGVPPLAGGVVRAKIGNLSSANALRVTLMSLLARTARKRVTYGRGILDASRLVLAALDSLGLLRTTPSERSLRLVWPDPLPEDLTQQVAAAAAKQDLGIPRQQVLAELGYAPDDAAVE